ncbi:phosphatase PAP2 family protein [Nocardia mangyaensis]|uniref:phosphatase PAP2 family protein n=1 Tax=Nocardia mangyaensis TaxID=2213200 RepID=UPI00267706A2|nr:phosphatase PAP2 family protein [Nocardia mangyaensis]MDO3647998.1 phosphatase PAP2 family protein [Nocardia mangyaensis]
MPIATRRPPPDAVAWSALGRQLPRAAGLIASLTVLIIALTWQVGADAGVTAIDQTILDWMIAHRGEPLTTVTEVITGLGDTLSMAVLAMIVAIGFAVRGTPRTAALVAMTSFGAAVLVGVIKPLVGRQRPPELTRLAVEPSLSYPSGHTLGTTVVVGIVALTVLPHVRRRWIRRTAAVAAVAFAIAVGLSRVYLGVHWSTDVAAGWSIGLLWLTVCVTVFPWVSQRFPERG